MKRLVIGIIKKNCKTIKMPTYYDSAAIEISLSLI